MLERPTRYLLTYGELSLKGRNRKTFEKELIKILKPRLVPLDGRIQQLHQKVLIHTEAQPERVYKALRTVFGLVGVHPIWQTSQDLDDICELAWRLMAPHVGSDKTFGVKGRRAVKNLPYNTMELQQTVAASLYRRGLDLKVDLKNPDIPLHVRVDLKKTWLYTESWPMLGGLPISPRSRHGLLLSGGIDSPVAGNMIQKRGGLVHGIYFHTPPFTVAAAKEKVADLAEVLSRYQNKFTLYVVNFTQVMKTLRAECSPALMVVLSRRFMMRVAERLLTRFEGQSLVTGESLGQVASQTIENITAVDEVVHAPILRPLIGMDKREIIARSEAMGAYDISIQPAQDCCSLFAPKEPATRSKLHIVHQEESKLDVDAMVEQALTQVEEMILETEFAEYLHEGEPLPVA